MRNRKTYRFQFCVIVTMSAILAVANVSSAGERPEPLNKVAIIVDSSASYRARQMEAMERAIALLDGMCARKLHRWEPAVDQITIISLDAIPGVLWSGSLSDLKTMEPNFWTARFRSRADYAEATDVTAAFNLAVRYLEGDPRYVHKYIFAFSDLIHEPPTDSICRPDKPSSLPTGDFPWDALKDVSVSVLWLPPEQKLSWHRAVEEHGLGSGFALYTTSESSEVNIQPPPKPEMEFTEDELKAEKKIYIGYVVSFMKTAGMLLLAFILVVGTITAGLFWGRRRRWSRSTPPGVTTQRRRRQGDSPSGR